MHFTTLTMLFAAATVLGAPTELTPSLATVSDEVLDQGDGVYFASYNETGVIDVDFTPMAEFEKRMAELDARGPVEQLSARDTHGLTKRDAVIKCSGRKSNAEGTLHEANRQLASNADAKRHYGANQWGWVHRNSETSFFCSYSPNDLTYSLIVELHTMVSGKCGQAGYGHVRREALGNPYSDLTVGRTFRGDHFCDGKVHS